MIKLYDNGVYLLNGTEIVEDAGNVQTPLTKEEAAKNTMAYGILKEHNTSSDMERLQIRFDKLTSHDITFVGIIQTARASGLEKFPMPYVLTNCHNSLCAVGGTINEDDRGFLFFYQSGKVMEGVSVEVFVPSRGFLFFYEEKTGRRIPEDICFRPLTGISLFLLKQRL